MTTANADKSGSFKIGGDLAVHRLGLRRHARHRQGRMGRAGRSRGGVAHAAPRARARHQPHRHGRQLRPGDQRAADPRGAASVQRPRHRHQGRPSAPRSRMHGSRAASPTICASRCSSACDGSASSASTSGNCTASIRACRAHEQFDAIAAMQKEGLIRHVGLSEVNVEEIKAAQKHFKVATVQNLFNLTNRSSNAVVDHCDEAQASASFRGSRWRLETWRGPARRSTPSPTATTPAPARSRWPGC